MLSEPLGRAADDLETTLWLKLEVQARDATGLIVGVDVVADFRDDPGQALIALSDAWSPDGRVLLLARAIGVGPQLDYRTQSYLFLDVYAATFAGFIAGGLAVTTDNFAGWDPTRPHSALRWVDDGRLERAELLTDLHPEGAGGQAIGSRGYF